MTGYLHKSHSRVWRQALALVFVLGAGPALRRIAAGRERRRDQRHLRRHD
ncbi:MAG: hypothetical protein R2849_04485 [Thermomicrobiales bacterium]